MSSDPILQSCTLRPFSLQKIRRQFGEVDFVTPQPVDGDDAEPEVEDVDPLAVRSMRGSGLAARQEITEETESDGLMAAGKEG